MMRVIETDRSVTPPPLTRNLGRKAGRKTGRKEEREEGRREGRNTKEGRKEERKKGRILRKEVIGKEGRISRKEGNRVEGRKEDHDVQCGYVCAGLYRIRMCTGLYKIGWVGGRIYNDVQGCSEQGCVQGITAS